MINNAFNSFSWKSLTNNNVYYEKIVFFISDYLAGGIHQ